MLLNLLYSVIYWFFVLFIVWRLFLLAYGFYLYQGLKKQGVPFVFGFNYFSDFAALKKLRDEHACTWDVRAYYRKLLNVDKLPPMLGVTYYGIPSVFINSAACLKDIYINKNMY